MSLKSYAWTTVERAANFGGLGTLTGTNETVMEGLINALTDYCESYIGKRIKKTSYTNEEYDSERSNVLVLKHCPVVSGETFTLDSRASGLNEENWGVVESKYYNVDNATGIIKGASGLMFSRSVKGYRVTYTAGYDFDNVTTFLSDTEAGELEMAIWMMVNEVYSRRSGGGAGIESESIGDYSVKYGPSMLENETVKSILDKHADVSEFGSALTPLQN